MIDLILYLGMTIVGYIAGNKARNLGIELSYLSKIQTSTIIILVIIMGLRMGSNQEVNPPSKGIRGRCDKMTLLILLALAVGTLSGNLFIDDLFKEYETFNSIAGRYVQWE